MGALNADMEKGVWVFGGGLVRRRRPPWCATGGDVSVTGGPYAGARRWVALGDRNPDLDSALEWTAGRLSAMRNRRAARSRMGESGARAARSASSAPAAGLNNAVESVFRRSDSAPPR